MRLRKPVAVVEWDDAFIDTDDFTMKDARKTKPCKRTTVGILVCKTVDGIVLATDEYAVKKEGYAARMFIPAGMVTDLYILEVPEDSTED
jgi:hypothetical protein